MPRCGRAAPVAVLAALFLFLGATGKSAQIPLYVWLPDAMAGPTPVSALIHAATMVTAGVYLVARMNAVFAAGAGRAGRSWPAIGALTALFAATIGFAQNDIKKVLAYSTVSQLGYMFLGVGIGAFDGGIFHLVTHAFFKACLFLGAGSVIHAMSGTGDITTMGGLRKKLPWTTACSSSAGWRSPASSFSGFFSKDAILAGAMSADEHMKEFAWVGQVAGFVLSIAALGTAFYMSRLYFLVFSGESRASTRFSTTSTSRPAAWSARWWCWRSARRWAASSGCPAACFEHADWNLLDRELSPVLGPEMEVAHSTEIGVMVGATRAGAAGDWPRLALLRRRLPRAGRASSPAAAPQAGQAGAGQVPHRRALPVPDRPSDPEGRPGGSTSWSTAS